MEQVYNKLVRDNIPDIIRSNNEVPFTRFLNDNEYREELYKKLLEECNEVVNSKSSEEVLEELADVFEVMESIVKLENKSFDDVKDIAISKKNKRGGFEKRIYLEKVLTDK